MCKFLLVAGADGAGGEPGIRSGHEGTVPGIANFSRVETTIACAGATTPAGVAR